MHILWHRNDLRTHDLPALHEAAQLATQSGEALLPLVIIDPKIFSRPDLTPRRKAWFLENTRALRDSYRKIGSDLVVREGDPPRVLAQFCDEFIGGKNAVTHLHFTANYTPYAKERDAAARAELEKRGARVLAYGGQYTHEPGTVTKDDGTSYSVFAPFRKQWGTMPKPEILDAPRGVPPLPPRLPIGEIARVEAGIELPESGEEAALSRLDWFVENAEKDYDTTRQRPDWEDKTSKLSYYFNIGALSPRLAQHRASTYKWKFELTWWDFFADLLDRLPESAGDEAQESWRGFPWRDDEKQLDKWARGETGFPLVDAGMRELQQTGFMHNRVRMATADFLTRHLMIDWRRGEEIFRGLLLCGDRAQNVGNWQWVAGCGISAKAYFRVGNPVTLAKKADPNGDYIRRWIPELADISGDAIFDPHKFGVAPKSYAPPLCDLKETRARYLETAKAHLAKSKANG